MGLKRNNLRQCLALAGLAFLTGATLPRQKLPNAAGNSHLTAPELTYARMDIPPSATNGGFLDDISLSLDPPVEIPVTDFNDARLNLLSDLPAGSFDPLQPRPDEIAPRTLTVADRRLNYQLYGSGGFAVKLNLEPAYPYPQALMPTRLDPGFGISLKF